MKKLLSLLILCFLLSFAAFAQEGALSKGSYLIGGSLGANYSSKNDISNFGLGISPYVGKFLADRFMVSLGPSIRYNGTKVNTSDSKFTNHYLRVGLNIGARYYLPNNLFGMAELGYERFSYNEPDIDVKGSRNITTMKLGMGYAWFLRPNIAIAPSLVYHIAGNKADWNELVLNAGLQFYLF